VWLLILNSYENIWYIQNEKCGMHAIDNEMYVLVWIVVNFIFCADIFIHLLIKKSNKKLKLLKNWTKHDT